MTSSIEVSMLSESTGEWTEVHRGLFCVQVEPNPESKCLL